MDAEVISTVGRSGEGWYLVGTTHEDWYRRTLAIHPMFPSVSGLNELKLAGCEWNISLVSRAPMIVALVGHVAYFYQSNRH